MRTPSRLAASGQPSPLATWRAAQMAGQVLPGPGRGPSGADQGPPGADQGTLGADHGHPGADQRPPGADQGPTVPDQLLPGTMPDQTPLVLSTALFDCDELDNMEVGLGGGSSPPGRYHGVSFSDHTLRGPPIGWTPPG